MRDMVSAERRALPWVKVEKNYVFDTAGGKKTLAELFGGNSQLIVYHFMWRWDLGQGCASCSFLADHVDGALCTWRTHDVTFVAISRGTLADLQAYKQAAGLEVRPDLVVRQRLQLRLSRVVHRRADEVGQALLQLRNDRHDARPQRAAGRQRVLSRTTPARCSTPTPVLRARRRRAARRLHLPRPHPERPQRDRRSWIG